VKGRISHVIGVDDAPFARAHRGAVPIVGVACAGERIDGVISSRVFRDGSDATDVLARMVKASRFAAHAQALLLEGIALAGFNVVDLHALADALEIGVLVVVKHEPDLASIKDALLTKVQGGAEKWALVEKAGPVEPLADVFVQRAGMTPDEATQILETFQLHGRLPEPLRLAHMIAGGVSEGFRA
jgi:endonuclease V-like protein UPF0215 family